MSHNRAKTQEAQPERELLHGTDATLACAERQDSSVPWSAAARPALARTLPRPAGDRGVPKSWILNAGELGVVDLYQHYQEWCRENHLRPFPSKAFNKLAKEEIEVTIGLKYRHNLEGDNGKAKRGWRGVGILERTVPGELENRSSGSVG